MIFYLQIVGGLNYTYSIQTEIEEDLQAVPDVGPVVAHNIETFFPSLIIRKLLTNYWHRVLTGRKYRQKRPMNCRWPEKQLF